MQSAHAHIGGQDYEKNIIYPSNHFFESFNSHTPEISPQYNRPQTLPLPVSQFTPPLNPSPFLTPGTPSNNEDFVKQEPIDHVAEYRSFEQIPSHLSNYYHGTKQEPNSHFSDTKGLIAFSTSRDLTSSADINSRNFYPESHSQLQLEQTYIAQSMSQAQSPYSDSFHFSSRPGTYYSDSYAEEIASSQEHRSSIQKNSSTKGKYHHIQKNPKTYVMLIYVEKNVNGTFLL